MDALPAGADAIAAEVRAAVQGDAWKNILTKLGKQGRDKRTGGTFEIDPVVREEAQQLWLGDSLARAVIETLPRDTYRRGYMAKVGDKKTSESVRAALEDMKFNRHFVRANSFERAFGGSALMPMLNDGAELFEPLEAGSYQVPKHITLFEPRELRPVSYYGDPRSEKYGEVEVFRLQPITAHGIPQSIQYIHESRLIIFPGIRVGRDDVPGAEPGWGGNQLTRVRNNLRDLNLSWGAAAALVQDFAQAVIKIAGLARLIDNNEDDAVVDRVLQMDIARSIIQAIVLDKDDEFERKQTPISGLHELLNQFMTWFAAQCDMPVTRLFGISPAGLNATGESDISMWDDRCEANFDEHRPQLEQGIRMILLAADGPTRGKEPDEWSVEMTPLRQPSEKETAEIRKIYSEVDKNNIEAELYSPEEAAFARFGGDTFGTEIVIDWGKRKRQLEAAPPVVVPESRQPPEPDPSQPAGGAGAGAGPGAGGGNGQPASNGARPRNGAAPNGAGAE